ncbi:MAG: nitroreductase [Anaerolineae bacterium]|nr:nitroreductase [Anaerolineae bacterium]
MSDRRRLYGVRKFNKRVFNPIILKFAGKRIYGVVHHKGRKSGRAYKNPVIAMPTGDGFVIPLTYGSDTDWCLNARAAGAFTLEHKGVMHQVGEPELIDTATVASAFPGWLRFLLRLYRIDQCLRVKSSPSLEPAD